MMAVDGLAGRSTMGTGRCTDDTTQGAAGGERGVAGLEEMDCLLASGPLVEIGRSTLWWYEDEAPGSFESWLTLML